MDYMADRQLYQSFAAQYRIGKHPFPNVSTTGNVERVSRNMNADNLKNYEDYWDETMQSISRKLLYIQKSVTHMLNVKFCDYEIPLLSFYLQVGFVCLFASYRKSKSIKMKLFAGKNWI